MVQLVRCPPWNMKIFQSTENSRRNTSCMYEVFLRQLFVRFFGPTGDAGRRLTFVGSDCELQDAPMISAIGVCGGSICTIQCCFRVKTPFFGSLPVTPGFWRELNLRTQMCSESPGCELQDTPIISAIEAHGGSLCSIQSRLRIKTPFFGSPPVTPGFGRELNLRDPRVLKKPGPRAARCTNDQLHRSMWGAYMPD